MSWIPKSDIPNGAYRTKSKIFSPNYLLIRLIFGDARRIILGLFQKCISNWALWQKRCLMACFPRAFGGFFGELLLLLVCFLPSRHPFELAPDGGGRIPN